MTFPKCLELSQNKYFLFTQEKNYWMKNVFLSFYGNIFYHNIAILWVNISCVNWALNRFRIYICLCKATVGDGLIRLFNLIAVILNENEQFKEFKVGFSHTGCYVIGDFGKLCRNYSPFLVIQQYLSVDIEQIET